MIKRQETKPPHWKCNNTHRDFISYGVLDRDRNEKRKRKIHRNTIYIHCIIWTAQWNERAWKGRKRSFGSISETWTQKYFISYQKWTQNPSIGWNARVVYRSLYRFVRVLCVSFSLCVYGTDADATAAAVVHFVHLFVGYCIFLQSNNMVYVVIGFYFLAYCMLWPFAKRKGNS